MEGRGLRLSPFCRLEGTVEDPYKGDSPGKKHARFEYWCEVQRMMGVDKMKKVKHLILVSRVAGDIPILKLLDVPFRNIIAVDRNPQAAFEAQEKWPSVKVICGDVVKVAAEYKRQIGSAFLDFCDFIDNDYVSRIEKIARLGMANESVIGCTFLCGREKDPNLIDTILRSKEYLKDYKVAEADRAALARGSILGARLFRDGLKFSMMLRPMALLHYVSATKDNKGLPMASMLIRADRYPGASQMKMNERAAREYSVDGEKPGTLGIGIKKLRDCNVSEDDFRKAVLQRIDELELLGDQESADLVPMAYNLSPGTIAAWKAHRTRGTYE